MSKPDWNTRYAQSDHLFGTAPNAFLRHEAHRLAPGSRVLCIADGEGRNGLWLAEQGHRVTSFDASTVAVEKARAWARSREVTIDAHLSGVDDWDWTADGFDAVVAIFVQFADPAMRTRLFAGMWRTLKPGGLLLVEGYTPKQLDHRTGGPGDVAHLYTDAMMRDLLPAADVLLLRSYEAVIEEGPAHSGLSGLLDLVARRPAA